MNSRRERRNDKRFFYLLKFHEYDRSPFKNIHNIAISIIIASNNRRKIKADCDSVFLIFGDTKNCIELVSYC